MKQFVVIADIPNLASICIMQKIGMRYDGLRNAHDLAECHPDMGVVMYAMKNSV